MRPGPGIDIPVADDKICIPQLIDVKCELLGKDPTRRVASGSVRLASRLHQVTIEPHQAYQAGNEGEFLQPQQHVLMTFCRSQ